MSLLYYYWKKDTIIGYEYKYYITAALSFSCLLSNSFMYFPR